MPKSAGSSGFAVPDGPEGAGRGLRLLLLIGCNERDRLTFPPQAMAWGRSPPSTSPIGADTTVFPGGDFFVNGTTVDPDGVDTVYFFVIGGNQNFSPFRPSPTTDHGPLWVYR